MPRKRTLPIRNVHNTELIGTCWKRKSPSGKFNTLEVMGTFHDENNPWLSVRYGDRKPDQTCGLSLMQLHEFWQPVQGSPNPTGR